MTRMSYLLNAAATALENGEDPLATPFLDTHHVTLTECYDLAGKLAAGARIIAWATENPQRAAQFARNAAHGTALEMIPELMARVNVTGG